MSIVINTNAAATIASMNLAKSSAALATSLNRLSSGSKIVNPADDAGGLAVSMKLSAATGRLAAFNSNFGNASSFLQTQDGVLKVAGEVLNRISELKTLSADPTKNSDDIGNYNSEFLALRDQLDSLSGETFNGVALFGTDSLSVQTGDDISAAISIAGVDLLGGTPGTPVTLNFNTNSTVSSFTPSGAGTLTATGDDLYFTGNGGWGDVIGTLTAGQSAVYDGAGGWTGLTTGSISGTTIQVDDDNTGGSATFTPDAADLTHTGNIANAASLSAVSLETITSAIQDIASHRASNGAQQSRIAFAAELVTVNRAKPEASVRRIVDVDVAVESTRLARFNTLVQAGTAMLSQANQSPQSVLRLISG